MANAVTITVDLKDLASSDIKAINNLMRNQSKKTTDQTVKNNRRVNKSFSEMGRLLKTLAGAAGFAGLAHSIIYVGKAAGRMSVDLETAFAEVTTISQDALENQDKLKEQILDLSTIVPQSAQTLTKGLYQAISAGVTDTSEAFKLLEVASKAAVGGLTDAATAIDATTNVMNAYQLSADKAANINDVLFTTVREGKVRYEELATTIGDIAPTGALLGVKFEELTAAMATMTKTGVNFNDAATQIRNIMLRIISPTDDARKAAEMYGIELSTAGIRAAGGLVPFLGQINAKIGDNIDALQAIFPEMRAFRGAAVLAGVQSQEFTRILGEMERATGAADRAFNIMADTSQNRLKKSIDTISVSLTKLADKVMPYVVSGMEKLAELIQFISDPQKAASMLSPWARAAYLTEKSGENAENLKKNIGDTKTNAEAVADALEDVNTQLAMSVEQTDYFIKRISGIERISDRIIPNFKVTSEKVKTMSNEFSNVNSGLTQTDTLMINAADNMARFGNDLQASVNDAFALESAFNSISSSFQKIISGKGSFRDVLRLLGGVGQASSAGSGIISSALGTAASFIPGLGPLVGAGIKGIGSIFGFQHQGTVSVPGVGAPDSRVFAAKVSPGEKISVTRPGFSDPSQTNQFNITVNLNSSNVTQRTIEREVIPVIDRYVKKATARR